MKTIVPTTVYTPSGDRLQFKAEAQGDSLIIKELEQRFFIDKKFLAVGQGLPVFQGTSIYLRAAISLGPLLVVLLMLYMEWDIGLITWGWTIAWAALSFGYTTLRGRAAPKRELKPGELKGREAFVAFDDPKPLELTPPARDDNGTPIYLDEDRWDAQRAHMQSNAYALAVVRPRDWQPKQAIEFHKYYTWVMVILALLLCVQVIIKLVL